MKSLLLATVLSLGLVGAAVAANVATFAQVSNSNTVTATVNGADTQTTLTATDAVINISQLISGAPPAGAFFSLNATSIDPATNVLGAAIQHFAGKFCLTTATGCGGTNILSGTFTDAAFGALSGPGLTVNVNEPPDLLVLTSDVIPASELIAPDALSLGFTNVSPALAIIGSTIAPFDASFAGTVSASAAVPEPTTLGVLGVGLVALGLVRRRDRPV